MKRLTTTYSIICLTILVGFVMFSCDRIEPAPPIDPHDYPTMVMTKSPNTNTVTEGSKITYTIQGDKPVEFDTPFTMYSQSGTASSADYKAPEITYPKFVVDAKIKVPVTFKMDNLPEKTEKVTYKIGIDPLQHIRLRQSISPDSKLPPQTITIKNHNDPSGLTAAFQWPNSDNDLDVFAFLDAGSDGTINGIAGASRSSDDPETIIISNKASDGTYYFGVNPYDVSATGGTTDYKYRVGYPNQKVDIFPGTFDVAKADTTLNFVSVHFDKDPKTAAPKFFLLLKVKKSGSNYKATFLDPGSSSSSSLWVNIKDNQVLNLMGQRKNK